MFGCASIGVRTQTPPACSLGMTVPPCRIESSSTLIATNIGRRDLLSYRHFQYIPYDSVVVLENIVGSFMYQGEANDPMGGGSYDY